MLQGSGFKEHLFLGAGQEEERVGASQRVAVGAGSTGRLQGRHL